MNPAGWAGLAMLGAGVLVMGAGAAFTLPALLRVRRLAHSVQAAAAAEGYQMAALGAEREELLAELSWRLLPFRRIRGWLTHPLTVALLESYRLRRKRAQGER